MNACYIIRVHLYLLTDFDFKFPSYLHMTNIGLDGVGQISPKVSSVVIFVALLVVLTGMLP